MDRANAPGEQSGDQRESAGTQAIPFIELLSAIWDSRVFVVISCLTAFTAAVGYSLAATEWYRATIVLAPSERRALPSGLSGQLGSLANLAGLSSLNSEAQQPLAVLRSQELARAFIEGNQLTEPLSSVGSFKFSRTEPGDLRDATIFFDERVREVTDDKKTGLVTLSIVWTDPAEAAAWANRLAAMLNSRMRDQALAEAERNIRFLTTELSRTTVVSLQQAMGRLLESEMQKVMLARGNSEFAYRVIDPATPPKYRSAPRRSLIVIMSVIFAGFLSVIIVLSRRYWPRGNSPARRAS